MRRLSICSRFQQGYGVLQCRTFQNLNGERPFRDVCFTAALVATLGICLSLICFDAPWQLSFCLITLFCVLVFSGTPPPWKWAGRWRRKKKMGSKEMFLKSWCNWGQCKRTKLEPKSWFQVENSYPRLFNRKTTFTALSLQSAVFQFLLSEPPTHTISVQSESEFQLSQHVVDDTNGILCGQWYIRLDKSTILLTCSLT